VLFGSAARGDDVAGISDVDLLVELYDGTAGERGRCLPPDFDRTAFDAAWYSGVPEDRNQAMSVRSNMDDLHNLCRLTPDDVHTAVNHQRQQFPSFIAGIGAWIQGFAR
jgi:hypothetical protein